MKKIVFAIFVIIFQTLSISQDYKEIKISEDLSLKKISENTYLHISFHSFPNFGRFSSNGLVFSNNGKAFLFDTPISDSLTVLLVSWIQDSLNLEIVGFVPGHWHNDCMGGLSFLQKLGIESYANQKTIEIAKEQNLSTPSIGFEDSLFLHLDKKQINLYFLGAGHSLDNIVIWIPSEKVLFGGCMIRDINSQGLGNKADGDVEEWPKTISRLNEKFPEAKIIIPGHGNIGGTELLQHTIRLLQQSENKNPSLKID